MGPNFGTRCTICIVKERRTPRVKELNVIKKCGTFVCRDLKEAREKKVQTETKVRLERREIKDTWEWLDYLDLR